MLKDTCHEFLASMDAYVDGELSPSAMLSAQLHVEGCAECADRVAFQNAMRVSVARTVRSSARTSERLRARVACVLAEEASSKPSLRNDQRPSEPRMLSWRVVGPLAAAAVLSLVLGSVARNSRESKTQSSPLGSASVLSLDTFLEDLVDQHANPMRPETTNPTEVARMDEFIGVPVGPPTLNRFQGTFLGARMLPLRQNRAAMLQYVLTSGHRVSVYVYNPRQVRMVASPRLRERVVENAPVYVGLVHGYSVAVTDHQGVGYALASDLDEQESSKMVLALDRLP